MYGFTDDNVKTGSPFTFGLNSGITKMVKFEWTNKGGKEGAEMEALDIVFEINGKEVKYRQFPITKAFEDGKEIIDPTHPAMVSAINEFNALMTHILTCFVPKEDYVKNLQAQPITSFKMFCEILVGMLPKDYATIPLDIFMQYQYSIKGENTQTFLEIPKNLKHGKFLCRTIPSVGTWKSVIQEQPDDKLRNALYYKDDEGNVHPFIRTGWYMNSPFAKQLKEEAIDLSGSASNPNIAGTVVNPDDKW